MMVAYLNPQESLWRRQPVALPPRCRHNATMGKVALFISTVPSKIYFAGAQAWQFLHLIASRKAMQIKL